MQKPGSVQNIPKSALSVLFIADKHRFVVQWGASGYKHTPDSKMVGVRQISAYTSHFFQRYRERFLKDESLSANDVAARYFSRNTTVMPLQQNEGITATMKNTENMESMPFVSGTGSVLPT